MVTVTVRDPLVEWAALPSRHLWRSARPSPCSRGGDNFFTDAFFTDTFTHEAAGSNCGGGNGDFVPEHPPSPIGGGFGLPRLGRSRKAPRKTWAPAPSLPLFSGSTGSAASAGGSAPGSVGGGSISGSTVGAPEGVPEELLCPISHEVMVDPVLAADGHAYERMHIEEWLTRQRFAADGRTAGEHSAIAMPCPAKDGRCVHASR